MSAGRAVTHRLMLVYVDTVVMVSRGAMTALRGRECIVCRERHRQMTAHHWVDHADEL